MAIRLSMQPLLVGLVSSSARRKGAVFVLGLVLMALAGLYSFTHLGFDTDVDQLFSARLPWKQREAAFNREFPQFKDLVVAVIDGRTPEEAEETASRARAGAGGRSCAFPHACAGPDASPFFDREGLLFLGTKQLTSLLDHTIDAQPFIGQLVADPSARGLFAALSLLGMGVEQGQADLTTFAGPAAAIPCNARLRARRPSRAAVLAASARRVARGPGGAVPLRARPARAGLRRARAGRCGDRTRCGRMRRSCRRSRPGARMSGSPGRCRSPTRSSRPSRRAR